jgi:hypothetical protein
MAARRPAGPLPITMKSYWIMEISAVLETVAAPHYQANRHRKSIQRFDEGARNLLFLGTFADLTPPI